MLMRVSQQMYDDVPFLQDPQDTMPLLLTWSLKYPEPIKTRVVSQWAASKECLSLFSRLIHELRSSKAGEELLFILAALLSRERLLNNMKGESVLTTRFTHLIDFDLLLRGHMIRYLEQLFEKAIWLLLRVLEILNKDKATMARLTALLGDLSRILPLTHKDEIFHSYWKRRVDQSQSDHQMAFQETVAKYQL